MSNDFTSRQLKIEIPFQSRSETLEVELRMWTSHVLIVRFRNNRCSSIIKPPESESLHKEFYTESSTESFAVYGGGVWKALGDDPRGLREVIHLYLLVESKDCAQQWFLLHEWKSNV